MARTVNNHLQRINRIRAGGEQPPHRRVASVTTATNLAVSVAPGRQLQRPHDQHGIRAAALRAMVLDLVDHYVSSDARRSARFGARRDHAQSVARDVPGGECAVALHRRVGARSKRFSLQLIAGTSVRLGMRVAVRCGGSSNKGNAYEKAWTISLGDHGDRHHRL
jgi:hypothetical protein